MSWKIVKKGRICKVTGIKIIRSKRNTHVYIGVPLRKRIGLKVHTFCNIYSQGSKIMLQFTDSPTKNSHKVCHGRFSVINTLVEDFLGNDERKEVSPFIEKENLIFDLKDLK